MNRFEHNLKEGAGVANHNYNKKKDTHPDFTGAIKIGGVIYKVSAWSQTDRNGMQSLSIVATEK